MNIVRDLAPLCRTRSTLMKAALARAWFRLGGYRGARSVDWARVARLVFVCKGNICRSPYAEFRARAAGMEAASFGLHARPGAPANPLAVEASSARGIDLTPSRTADAQAIRLSSSDLVIAMEPWHYREMEGLCRWSGAQRTLLGIWGGMDMPWLPDPYSGSRETFDHCYAVIDPALGDMMGRIRAAEKGMGQSGEVVG